MPFFPEAPENFSVLGCPVADKRPACPRCGGGWPGTKITTEKMTKNIISGTLKPERLGCLPMQGRAAEGYSVLKDFRSPFSRLEYLSEFVMNSLRGFVGGWIHTIQNRVSRL